MKYEVGQIVFGVTSMGGGGLEWGATQSKAMTVEFIMIYIQRILYAFKHEHRWNPMANLVYAT